MPRYWKLTSRSGSNFVVVRAQDKALLAKYPQAPLSSITPMLDYWLDHNGEQKILEEIHKVLSKNSSALSQVPSVKKNQIKNSLTTAFKLKQLLASEVQYAVTQLEGIVLYSFDNISPQVQGEDLQVLIAQKISKGRLSTEGATALIKSGKVSDLENVENSGTGRVTACIRESQELLLIGPSVAAKPAQDLLRRPGSYSGPVLKSASGYGTGSAVGTGSRNLTSLNELLQQTLLFSASPKPKLVSAVFPMTDLTGGRPDAGASLEYSTGPGIIVPGDLTGFASAQNQLYERQAYVENEVHNRKIWEFETSGVAGIRNLTMRHRALADKQMPVLEEVTWGDVKVTYQGKDIMLPLAEAYLLRTYYLEDGDIPSSEVGFWQLPMNLDRSFQRVFGYQVTNLQSKPLGSTLANSPTLMARPAVDSAASPLYVIVCMALGCAKERNDFEPGGVLGAARVIPHFMIVANQNVDRFEAMVTMTRPRTTGQCHMEEEEMTHEIGSGLFTDHNGAGLSLPLWSNIFDYYWINPPKDKELKAVRRDKTTSRSNTGAIKELQVGSSRAGTYSLGYKGRTIEKVPRQGEFDNIHIAPRMKLPASVVSQLPSTWPREAIMAPFCVHDCFHLHWRWGKASGYNPKWVCGWNKEGMPYQEAGAPLVAHNQDVNLKLLSPTSISYRAEIHSPAAGQWQVVLHHGAAYAVSYSLLAEIALTATDLSLKDLPGESGDQGKWALFYWHLRYQFFEHLLRNVSTTLADLTEAQDTYQERLIWDKVGLSTAREL